MEDKVVSGSTPSPASEQPASSGPEPVSVDVESLEAGSEGSLAAPKVPNITPPSSSAAEAPQAAEEAEQEDARVGAALRDLGGESDPAVSDNGSVAAAVAKAVEASRSEPAPASSSGVEPEGSPLKRSSPPPPPSRRNSDATSALARVRTSSGPPPAPSTRAASQSSNPPGEQSGASHPGRSASPTPSANPAADVEAVLESLPPVELRRVLPPKSDGTEMERAPAVRSSLPPALVQPNRIIEVIGSDTPVFNTSWDDDVEELDDSEAYEVYDSLTPEEAPPTSEVEIDLRDMDSLPPEDDARQAVPPKKKPRPGTQQNQNKPPPPKARRSRAPVKAWWEQMFSDDFLRAIPILPPRQLAKEADFIERSLEVQKGGRILDLACGAGQHAVELASRGYEVVGFDASQSQLDWAQELATERGQTLQFINGDMRMLTYQETFDAVCCWNTSFGYFEEEKNIEVASRIFASLRPGGRLLLDVVNRDFVVAEQPGQTWFEGDGCVCIDDVTIDFITSRLRVKRTMMLTSGKNCECGYSVRLYCLHELGKILHDVGFQVLEVSGRPETPGVFFGETSPRLMILASKPT